MGEDIDLPALHHRAARGGRLRRSIPVEALLKHSPLRIEASRRPEWKRFCGDPVAITRGADARRSQIGDCRGAVLDAVVFSRRHFPPAASLTGARVAAPISRSLSSNYVSRTNHARVE